MAAASVFAQDIDDPRFRALKIATRLQGEVEISLFDGDTPVRTETIRVVEPDTWRFDFTVQNQVAPANAALGRDEPVLVVELTRVPAIVRFGFEEAEVIASGRIESIDDLVLERFSDDRPESAEEDEFRTTDQFNSGDLVSVLVTDFANVALELANGEVIYSSRATPLEHLPRDFVDELKLIVAPQQDPARASIAVYGLDRTSRVVVGLDPIVTLDGQPLEPYSGQIDYLGALFADVEWPWLFALPTGVTSGSLEARWRNLAKSVELAGEE